MKLDSRVIEGMKPLGVFDTEEAKRFIGKECYFANAESVFSNIDDNPFVAKGILTSIDENSEYAFHSEGTLKSMSVRHILPCEWVKPEKKYRPFTNEEFLALFDSGKLHSIRKKNEKGRYIITDVYFNDEYEKGTVFVKLNSGGIGLAMRFLVNNGYEYFNGKDWQPFGVEIEE